MWGDALRVDQPVQYRCCPVGGIGREPVRLQTKALVNLVGARPLPSQRVEAPGYFNRDAAWTRGLFEDRYCLDKISDCLSRFGIPGMIPADKALNWTTR